MVTVDASRGLRVLVVDDNPDDFTRLLDELRHGGYAPEATRVDTAAALIAIHTMTATVCPAAIWLLMLRTNRSPGFTPDVSSTKLPLSRPMVTVSKLILPLSSTR